MNNASEKLKPTVMYELRAREEEEEEEEEDETRTQGDLHCEAIMAWVGAIRVGMISMSAVIVSIWNFKSEVYLNYLEKFENCCWWLASLKSISTKTVMSMLRWWQLRGQMIEVEPRGVENII